MCTWVETLGFCPFKAASTIWQKSVIEEVIGEIGRSVLIMAVTFLLGLIPLMTHDVAADSQGSQTVTLDIDGMTCGTYVKDVKASLAQVPGVRSVEIGWERNGSVPPIMRTPVRW